MPKAEHTLVFKTREDRLRYIHRHDTWEDMLEALKNIKKYRWQLQHPSTGTKKEAAQKANLSLIRTAAQAAIAKAEAE